LILIFSSVDLISADFFYERSVDAAVMFNAAAGQIGGFPAASHRHSVYAGNIRQDFGKLKEPGFF